MYNLKSSYEVVGRTMETLLSEIKEVEDNTEYVTVAPGEITLASYKECKDGTFTFYTFNKKTMKDGVQEKGVYAPFNKISVVKDGAAGVNPDLLLESVQEAGAVLIAPVEGAMRAIYVAPGGISSLAEKAKVGGERVNTPSALRDAYIMEGIINKAAPLKLVIRSIEEDGRTDRKLFGVLTEKYKPISLSLIPDTINAFEEDGSMGMAELRFWRNTQNYIEVLVEFPDAADEIAETYGLSEQLIPGIRMSTSDTGDAAVRIQSTYRSAGAHTCVVKKEVKKNHMGKVTKEDILKDAKKEIFAEISELPKRLASMIGKTIGEPDVTTPEGREKNKITVQAAIRKAFRKLHIGKAIGQKRAKDISTQLEIEVNGSLIYTEYDIAMMFIGLGDRIANLPENARKALEKACAEAPYVNFSGKNDEEEWFLLPEEV